MAALADEARVGEKGTLFVEVSGSLLRIFTGEATSTRQALYESIVLMLRREGLAGATVFRRVEGSGPPAGSTPPRCCDCRRTCPMSSDCVDRAANIERVLPILDAMITEGLVTVEKADIRIYRGHTSSR